MSFGIITIVEGPFYARMAKALALSLRLHCPKIPTAVVCSKEYMSELNSYFDTCIEVETDRGSISGFEQKLHLDHYSPFQETLYLDCDSLVYRALDFIPSLYIDSQIGFVGKKVVDGKWYNLSISELCNANHLNYIIQVQGGYLYFKKGETSDNFFSMARVFHKQSSDMGVATWSWRGEHVVSDELAIGLALAKCGIDPIEDHGVTMRYPMGLRNKPIFEIFGSICRLDLGPTDYANDNHICEPAVMHFCTWHNHKIYTRERIKLDLYNRYRFLKPVLPIFGPIIQLSDLLCTISKNLTKRSIDFCKNGST